jgi:hypothetical protein
MLIKERKLKKRKTREKRKLKETERHKKERSQINGQVQKGENINYNENLQEGKK